MQKCRSTIRFASEFGGFVRLLLFPIGSGACSVGIVLDHIFTDAIGALRESLEHVLLERQAVEEHFTLDLLLGDTSWDSSYGLPGEHTPARVRTDIRMSWPTWSQTAYRTWSIGEDPLEPPTILLVVVFRIQELRSLPDPFAVVASLSTDGPDLGAFPLTRTGPTMETSYGDDLDDAHHAVEVSYECLYELPEEALRDGSVIDDDFNAIGGWVSSTLVQLGDLQLDYRPADL